MPSRHFFGCLAAATALAACVAEQRLPTERFEHEARRTIGAAGGMLSTPAGATLIVPIGALSDPVELTLRPAPLPTGLHGAPAGPASFVVEPAGQSLARQATLDLKLAEAGAELWTATVLQHLPGNHVRRLADAQLDLSNRLLRAMPMRLGSFTVVIPPANTVFPFSASGTAMEEPPSGADFPLPAQVRALRFDCRPDPLGECTELGASASGAALARFARAALLGAAQHGQLVRNADGLTWSGALRLSGVVRLVAGASAISYAVRLGVYADSGTRVRQTASGVRISGVTLLVEEATETGGWRTIGSAPGRTLDVLLTGDRGMLELPDLGVIDFGSAGTARVLLRIPVTLSAW